jgi:GDP-L-fucose synthase
VTEFWPDKQALVTGGGGFLGSHVVVHLRAAGCRDVFVARSRDYDLTREPDVERMFADAARQRPALASLIVFHIAGLSAGIGANLARPAEFFYQNALMNTLTLHHAWQAGAVKAVTTAAGCGYPLAAPNPLREACFWDGFPQAETAPYALAKRMLHIQAIAYWQQYQFPTVVAVPGNLYGPHDNFDSPQASVVPALVRKFVVAVEAGHTPVSPWGTGRATRDLVFVGDVAAGLLRAAEVYQEAQLVNLASGVDTSIRQVVETLATLTGFKGDVIWDTSRPDGQAERRLDITKAQHDLNWRPQTPLHAGLRLTVEAYRAARQARGRTE